MCDSLTLTRNRKYVNGESNSVVIVYFLIYSDTITPRERLKQLFLLTKSYKIRGESCLFFILKSFVIFVIQQTLNKTTFNQS